MEAARLQGLLALPWDDDLGRLACALGARTGRVVLDEATYACYQRVLDRILAIWSTGSPLIRSADRRTSFPGADAAIQCVPAGRVHAAALLCVTR